MFESILADILNRYLEPYVKKLDTSQLRLGIWKGNVCLENLELKEEIFTDLGVPVIIKSSHIGKIILKIPWKNLTKESILVTIEDVYVIAGPVAGTVYDEKKEKERSWEKKQAKLKDIEETRKKQESQKEEKDTFFEKLITHIVKNLIVKVHSIHIRYEDTVTNPSHPMVAGITLDSIEMQTTDDSYNPCVIKESATLIYKLIQMDCLAFYWMVDTIPLANLLDAEVMKNKMKTLIARKGQGSVGVNYILQPLTADARMKLNVKPNYHDNDLKVMIDVSNEMMELVFRRSQYCSVLDTMESLDRAFVQHRYHKYRDKLHSNKSNRARAWWEYAITCILEEQVKRKYKMWSWINIKMTRERNRLYTEKYLDKITSFTTSSSVAKELEAMEKEMDLFAILLCRQQAVNQKKHKAIKKMAKKAVKEEAKAEKLLQKQQQEEQKKQIEQQQKQREEQKKQIEQQQKQQQEQKKQIEQQQKQQQEQKKQIELQQKQQLLSPAPPAEPEKKSTGFFSRLKNRLKHGDQPSSEAARKPQQQQQPSKEEKARNVQQPQLQPSKEEKQPQSQSTVVVPTKEAKKSAEVIQQENIAAEQLAIEQEKLKKSAKEIQQENIAAEQLAIEREKLFEAIGYFESGPKEEYPREYIAERVNLKLKLLAVTLVDDRKSKKIGHVETTNITASVVHRPADNGVTIHGSVGAITVLGVAHESHDTTIVSTPETKEETGEPSPLIVIQFDVHPLGMSSDFMLFASLNPLEIVYDSETVDSIINMFLIQKVIHFQELMAATMATVDQLQSQTRAGLEYVLKKRKLIDVKLSLKSPYIVIPTRGVYNSSASVIVVDLGSLEVTSSSKEFVGSAKNREVEDYYDTFNIKLSTVQVLMAKPGEDWRHAREKTDITTSRLHILKPAGMELVIQKSILQQDALLPSLKVKGAFSSFEVFISDARLKELIKVLLSIPLPPPSLKNATKFIEIDSDILSVMVTEKNLEGVIDKDLDSLLPVDDQGQPHPPKEVESEPRPSITSQSASTVFTQLSLDVNIKQISVELSQEEDGELVKPLLHLQISEVMANVRDRSWDSSAAISVKDIVIFDHITLDSSNAPVKLLEADTLSSGKVLSVDAVLLSQSSTKKELVAKLTNGESTINCNMSLLRVNIHENTMVELSCVAFLLAPLLLEIPERQGEDHTDSQTTVALPTKPTSSTPTIINLKVNVQACFKGLKVTVSDVAGPFIITEIKALQLAGVFSNSKKEITASMDGLAVTDLCGVSSCAQVISVSGGNKKLLKFKAVMTRLPSDVSGSGQSELELSLEVQQLKVFFMMQLFLRFLMMISHFHFDPTFVNTMKEQSLVARAKKGNKVTTSTPVGSSAAKTRAKLNLRFHAPIITLPIVGSSTALKFDLGDFELTTTDSRVITQPNGFKYVQETIRITSNGLRADRVSSDDSSSCEILSKMKFDVNIVRSLLENPVDIPLVDVQLKLESVKVHLCSKEIVAILLLVSSFDELTQIGKEISHSAVGSGRTKHSDLDILPVTTDSSVSSTTVPTGNALLAKVTAELDTLQLDVAPLCSAKIKSIKTVADVDDVKIKVSTSVQTMTVFDLAKEDRKITSYLEKSKPFAELHAIIYQKAHEMMYSQDIPLPIKMDLDVNLSSFHLILNMGFINRAIEFGQTVAINKRVLKKLVHVTQEAVSVLPDELARYNIFVSAPLIYLSLPKATHGQALILNCGQMKLNNSYLKLEGEVKNETSSVKKPAYINRYSFSLTQLTISRSIVAFYEESIRIKAQHTLLQPIQFTANLSNSLSPNVTSIPTTCIEANLGNVEVSYGDEDVKSVVNYVATIIGNFKPKTDSEIVTKESLSVQTSYVDRIATDQQRKSTTIATTGTTATPTADVLAFNAILESFTINTYVNEPLLSPKLATAGIPSSNALMIVKVCDLSVTGNIEANGHKVAHAELGDIEIIDAREQSSNKMTRKLLQSFKADPTKDSTTETSGPIVKVKFNSSTESCEDYVNVKGRQILVLLDVDFILCVQAYANSIHRNILNPKTNKLVHDALESLKSSGQKADKMKFAPSGLVEENKRGFKLQGIMEKFTVVLLDPEQSVGQVVILQTNVFSNLSMDNSKGKTQLSLRLDSLTMTSSHLLKLDSPTSHFLLPALVNVVFSIDTKGTTKLNLWVDVDCITLNISPAIISLLVNVVSAIVPKKKIVVPKKLENLEEVINKDVDSLVPVGNQSHPCPPTDVENEPRPSITSQSASTVFTQLSLDVSIKQINVELSQEEDGELVKSLLHLQISEVMANVREKSWDFSAAISVKDIVIFDHITLDSSNVPVKLLEADTLSSGKVLSMDAVLLSQSSTKKELVAKLTNGESTINCNMSLLRVNIHENTMVELSRVAFLLAPLFLEIPKRQAEDHTDSQRAVALPTKPTSSTPTIINLKVNVQACFKGLKVTVSDVAGPFIITEIQALQLAGMFSNSKKEITASIDGLAVTDLCGVSSCAHVISVSGGNKKLLKFKAVMTRLPSDVSESGQSELELSLEVQQLKVFFMMQLFLRFLMMISHLHFDPTFVNTMKKQSLVARAKKRNKVTTSAPVGSSAAKTRAKLNLRFHAPIITLPIVGSSTALKFDLGDFELTTTDSRVITQSNGFKYVQETIRITSDGIRADRVSSDDSSSCGMLSKMKFDVNIVRSLLENPVDIPLVDVQLKSEFVKVHLCNKEIVAILLLVSSFDELTQIGKEISHSAVGIGGTKHSDVDILPVTNSSVSSTTVVKNEVNTLTGNVLLAKVTAELDNLQLDIAPLCSAKIKSIKTVADVDDIKIKVSTSVQTMTVFDLAKPDRKITSYLEKSKPFAELHVIIYQKAHEMTYSQDILLPIKMDLDVNLSSFHLILNMGFINRAIEFGRTVAVDKKVLEKLAHVAQEAASVLPDELGRYNIFVSAPVIYLSLPKATNGQALILNCGQMKLNNSYFKLEGEVKNETSTVKKPAYINRYSFSLTQLTISRSIVAFYEESIRIKAQRTLLHPIQFTANLSHSLSPNVTSIPSTCIEANLGNVEVSYGDEDVKSVVNYVATIIGNFKPKTDSEIITKESLSIQTSYVDRIATDQQRKSTTIATTGTTATPTADVLAFNAILESFTINTYVNEPLLSPKLNTAAIPSSNALMIVKVCDLSVTGNIEADGHKIVHAELSNIEIIDAREQSRNKMTRKLLQSFKADPTKDSTTETSGPIVKVKLNSSTESCEDYVNVKGRQLLVLLDVDFILCVQAYANSIYRNILNPKANELVRDALESLKSSGQKADKMKFAPSGLVEENKRGFKLQGIVEKFTVVLLDPEQSVGQVVILQTNVFSNLSMDNSKGKTQLSLRLDSLTMTSSHLLKLDSPTSHFLLPALVNVVFSIDTKGTTKLNLWVDVDCITLNISPAIISLLVNVVSAIVPKKKEAVKDEQLSPDIWNKHELPMTAWYLMPVLLKRAVESSVDALEWNEVVAVEVKRFEINISRGHGPVNAELALNGNVYLEVNDITSALQARATLQMEASYYNDHHSLWEPLIEPLEDVNGKHVLWTGKVTVKRNLSDDDIDSTRASVTSLSSLSSLADSSARYKAKLSADSPLQVTLSKKSLSLIKDTAEVYSANVSRDEVTHKKPTHEFSTSTSAFTIKNKLGPGIVVFIQPGETLKFLQEQKHVKFGFGEMVDLAYVCAQDGFSRESKSVLLRQPKKKEVKHCIDIKVAQFDPLKGISLVTPGLFYYTVTRRNLKTNAIDKVSIVVEIIFSDTKKNVFIRSPIQVQNHTNLSIDLIIPSVQEPHVIPANSYHPIPLDKMNEPISFKPSGKGLDTSVMLHWMSREFLSVVKCVSHNKSPQRAYYLKVVKEVEDYANSEDVIIDDDNPHHVMHIYPPAVLCNLLPVAVTVMDEVVGEGKDMTLLQLNPQELEPLKITFNDGRQNVHGVFPVFDDMEEFTHFIVGEGRQVMELSVHREDLGYHRLSLYASYWMVNKTNLTLEYQDFESKKRTIHNPGQEIMCYACDQRNQKGKTQISAKLGDGRHTDWSAVISLNAAGTRGCARLKCGNVIHDLGIKIQLSRFTLTKVVTISPYYLVHNDTQHYIKCVMGDGSTVQVSSKNVKALWPKTTDPFLHIIIQGYTSRKFQYRTLSNNKDNIVENVLLKMDQNVVAIVVEFNITQNSYVITFSSYYSGAMPAKIVNACDSFSIRIRQNTASAKEQLILGPRETAMYTWDDPIGSRSLWWSVIGNMEKCTKPISLSKNSNSSFKLPSGFRSVTNVAQIKDTSWTVIEESDDGFTEIVPDASSSSSSITASTMSSGTGGYWISFLDHLQRVVMFTQDQDMVECAKAGEETGWLILDFSASLKNIGVSLVNNSKKKEIAYIGITQSSVIWEVKKKNKWITINNEIISLLEEEYSKNPKAANIERGKLQADLNIMQIYSPYKGQLRRTYYDGLSVHFKLNEKQIELSAKLGHMQVDNQLPFSVYPQVLYPLPPPPTVASSCEPKPFIEASVIIRRSDKVSMAHIQYAGLLIQEMAVNVDLGFLLSIISFFTLSNSQSRLGEYVLPQKKEALLPLIDILSSTGKDITVSRYFFTLVHFSPIKIRLSFNIRSYGKNLDPEEDTVAKQALNLLLHSLGVVLTSVQETEMKYAYLHLEYQQVTLKKLKDVVVKHYSTQTLYQIYSLIFGLDMLGNPVSVVKGVAGGAIDLFYEPYKGVVLGGDEFLQGLGIGLKSFLGGTVGGIAGAGAKVTGAVGDVFAKLTFDEEFIDRRQHQKAAPPKLGSKLGGFAKNVFQGVTGVVTQPVKGAKQEGVFGLAKGMSKGVVGLVMKPTGGLIDLASGSLDTVRRGTSLNNVEVLQMRPPRFIDREGTLTPYSAKKAQGNALLLALENGEYAITDCYITHMEVSSNPLTVLLITDMRILVVQKKILHEILGWSISWEIIHSKVKGIQCNEDTLEAVYKSKRSAFDKLQSKYSEYYQLPTKELAMKAVDLINTTVEYNK